MPQDPVGPTDSRQAPTEQGKSERDNQDRGRSEYVVVARRYRPQSFQELVGQSQVSQALATAITTNRVGHAYLFTGARGVGKTSTARIFAKSLNCKTGPTPTPCNQCDICRAISAGEDIDVLEIDGASNRGIDEIRQLRSNVSIHPSRSRFKIYIIDEVHMLTLPAFNALLKTLEEPPEHVKFIFCTTEPEKIPITILSRCQRYDFPPVESSSIVERLRFIVKTEGAAADDEALQLLARRANGSMRDSQSLLEQLLSFAPSHISVQDVHAMLGTARGGQLAALAQKLVDRDAAGALQEIARALSEGVDAGQLTEQLAGYFRDMLAVAVGCGPDLLLHAMPADFAQLQQTGERLGVETLLAMVQILDQALGRMRYSTHVRTLLELAIVRIARLESLDELSELVGQLRQGTGAANAAPSVSNSPVREKKNDVAVPTHRSGAPSSTAISQDRDGLSRSLHEHDQQFENSALPDRPTPELQKESSGTPELPTSSPSTLAMETVSSDDEEETPIDLEPPVLAEVWKQALEQLGDMTADFARQAESVQLTAPNRLVAKFRAACSLHKEYCERPDRRTKLESALAKAIGRTVRLDLELLPADLAVESRPVPVQTNRQRMQERQRQPLVRQAIEMFDGEVLRVDEPRPGNDERT
jgi:DNA polymerase-3 subunit gamma/tau